MNRPRHERAANWTRYWATGALHSCMGSFSTGYGECFSRWWGDRFATLAEHQCVLDLATGGGPLPFLLANSALERKHPMPQVFGVDLAEVRFEWLASLPNELADRIAVQGGVRMEALPFADGSMDRICSHFGFEYADADATISEIARCLSLDGTVSMVMHHRSSVISAVAEQEAAHLDWLLSLGGPVDVTLGMIAPMARAATAEGRAALARDASAAAAREAFNIAMRALQSRAVQSTVPDALHEAGERANLILAHARAQGAESAMAQQGAWRQGLEDALLRQRELLACAFDSTAAAGLKSTWQSRGFSVDLSPLMDAEGRLLGWGIDVDRSA